jgi:hypothetical protein
MAKTGIAGRRTSSFKIRRRCWKKLEFKACSRLPPGSSCPESQSDTNTKYYFSQSGEGFSGQG